MKKYWLVSAHKKEIPGIEKLLLEKTDILYFQCGIGLFESFFNFSNLVNSMPGVPEGIFLLGTAGSPDSGDLFRVVLANEFIYPQFGYEDLPEFLPRGWSTQLPVNLNTAEFNKSRLYSTFGISTGQDHLNESMKGAWENMEALSLSYVCMKKQIPFAALLCCSNKIGPEGRREWKENYEKAGEILLGEIRKILA